MSRCLLVPMDDSETARAALEHALTMFLDDKVTVVHAVNEPEAGYSGRPPVPDSGTDTDEPEFFTDVREIAAERDRTVETAIVEGTSAVAILEYARDNDVDGIVMRSEAGLASRGCCWAASPRRSRGRRRSRFARGALRA